MKFAPTPPELIALFNAVLPLEHHNIEPRKMLGYPCCYTGGHMFMGVFESHMWLRLSPSDREELLAKGGTVFEPTPGRPMQEYITVPASVLENQNALRDWVARSYAYGASLPPKDKTSPKSESLIPAADVTPEPGESATKDGKS
jgi:TfoX/Sxy family transcriptional regulator of competence genes